MLLKDSLDKYYFCIIMSQRKRNENYSFCSAQFKHVCLLEIWMALISILLNKIKANLLPHWKKILCAVPQIAIFSEIFENEKMFYFSILSLLFLKYAEVGCCMGHQSDDSLVKKSIIFFCVFSSFFNPN